MLPIKPSFSKSLSNKILLKMVVRITIVFICAIIYSYFHNKNIYDLETLEHTVKTTKVRAEIDSDYFMTAEKNVNSMQKEFLRRMSIISTEKAKEKFNELFGQDEKDGHWRNKGIYSDHIHYAPTFLFSTVKLTDNLYKSAVISYEIANEYGAALKNKYYTTYVLLKEGGESAWSPEEDYSRSPLCAELLPDFIKDLGGSLQRSPNREVYWTDVYYDKDEKKWMLTVTMPIDLDGEWLGGVSHDLLIEDSLKRIENVSIPGSYNLVFSKTGALIVSNEFKSIIEENGGQLELSKINNPKLKNIWEAVAKLDPNGESIMCDNIQAYLGVKKIEGPNWLLVRVVPYSLISQKANASIKIVVFIFLLSLFVELFIIYRILKKEVANPLNDLIKTTKNIYAEPHLSNALIARQDELGILAQSINSMAQEVTENKKNLEEKVQDRTQELSISNRLLLNKNDALDQLNQEKNKLISIANHDLKNPLAITTLLVDMVKIKIKNNQTDQVEDKLSLIKEQSQRMLAIINEHLNYILIEENSHQVIKSTFNLSDLIDKIIIQNDIALKNKNLSCYKNIDKSISISSSIIYWEAIIENLLSNSIKYSTSDKNITIDLIKNESHIILSITDQGLGIPKEEQHLIFQKFVKLSTKPTGGENSTGLGLSIVKQLVDKIGAKIRFESSPLGTRFTVEFPLSQ